MAILLNLVKAINDRCTINRDGRQPMATINRSLHPAIARTSNRGIYDRSYEHSWHPATERTINRGTRRPMVRSIVGCNDRSHDQSLHRATDRSINRCYLRPIVRSIAAPNDVESQVRRFEHDQRPCDD